MKKESVLDEEAYIYNHRNDENEGDNKWKKMNGRQKLVYFNDYYRNKIIAVIVVLGFVISLAY